MNKRSAMLIAGGLVIAMGLAALAVSLGITGPAPAVAAQGRATPIVRVERRTVTIQRGAEDPSAAAVNPGDDDHGSDEGWEHEGEEHESEHGSDDGFEFEDD